MNKLNILRGLPASGKSTWAREWVAEDRGSRIRVNRDDIRNMLKNKWKFGKDEDLVTEIEDSMILSGIKAGKDVVVDATNFRGMKRFKDLVAHHDVQIELKTFDTPLEICIRRDAHRGRKGGRVGPNVIIGMHNKYLAKEGEEIDISQFPEHYPDPRIAYQSIYEDMVLKGDREDCIICDLDGTLSLMSYRSPYEGEKCESDVPNMAVDAILTSLYMDRGVKIFLFSGRNSDKGGAEATKKWLEKNVDFPYTLAMREPGDTRPDVVVKEEMYQKHIEGKYVPLFVLDDRDVMVDHWRSKGFDTLQVNYGNF